MKVLLVAAFACLSVFNTVQAADKPKPSAQKIVTDDSKTKNTKKELKPLKNIENFKKKTNNKSSFTRNDRWDDSLTTKAPPSVPIDDETRPLINQQFPTTDPLQSLLESSQPKLPSRFGRPTAKQRLLGSD